MGFLENIGLFFSKSIMKTHLNQTNKKASRRLTSGWLSKLTQTNVLHRLRNPFGAKVK